MERLNPALPLRRYLLTGLLAMAALLVATACGPKVIKGRPPFISISSMNLVGETLTVEFDISNQNGVAMNITSIDIAVTMGASELIRYGSTAPLEIDANSTEELRAVKPADTFTRNVLGSLESGELNSVAFDLEGQVRTVEEGKLKSEHTGYLYPVPGKPGHFRAAVTRAKGLVREDPL